MGEKFIGNDDVCLILGDNIFYSEGLTQLLKKAVYNAEQKGKQQYLDTMLMIQVVLCLLIDKNGSILEFEEKPIKAKSNYGCWFYFT